MVPVNCTPPDVLGVRWRGGSDQPPRPERTTHRNWTHTPSFQVPTQVEAMAHDSPEAVRRRTRIFTLLQMVDAIDVLYLVSITPNSPLYLVVCWQKVLAVVGCINNPGWGHWRGVQTFGRRPDMGAGR